MKHPKGWPKKRRITFSPDKKIDCRGFESNGWNTAVQLCEKALEGYEIVPKEKLSEDFIASIIDRVAGFGLYAESQKFAQAIRTHLLEGQDG